MGGLAVHGLKNIVGTVLDGYVYVFADLIVVLYLFDKPVGYLVLVAVHQTDPLYAFYNAQFPEKLRQSVRLAEVASVAGNVLGYDHKFFAAFSGKFARFVQNVLFPSAPVSASYERYYAVTADVRAAFGDLKGS